MKINVKKQVVKVLTDTLKSIIETHSNKSFKASNKSKLRQFNTWLTTSFPNTLEDVSLITNKLEEFFTPLLKDHYNLSDVQSLHEELSIKKVVSESLNSLFNNLKSSKLNLPKALQNIRLLGLSNPKT